MDQDLTLEYIFFHHEPHRRFCEFLAAKQIPVLGEELDETDVEGLVVHIQDNLDDELSDEIEAFYDEMMELTEQLVAADGDSDELSRVGLAVSLSDGRSVLASVEPDVLNRVLTVVSHQELGGLVDAIVDAVENPDQRPLCKRA